MTSSTPADLDETIRIRLVVRDITLVGDPFRASRLFGLGIALRARFRRAGVLDDLNEAVRAMAIAADITPADDPGRAGRLSNLGLVLRTKFERAGTLGDVDEAVRVGTMALDAGGEDHPDRVNTLTNLGGSHTDLWNLTEAQRLSEEALDLAEAAGAWTAYAVAVFNLA